MRRILSFQVRLLENRVGEVIIEAAKFLSVGK